MYARCTYSVIPSHPSSSCDTRTGYDKRQPKKNLIIEPKLIENRLKQLETSGYHFNMNLDLARSPIHRQFVFKAIRGFDSRFSLSAKLADRKL